MRQPCRLGQLSCREWPLAEMARPASRPSADPDVGREGLDLEADPGHGSGPSEAPMGASPPAAGLLAL
jgi:hypothetical protein